MLGMQPKKCHFSLNGKSDYDMSNELNAHSKRFNIYDFNNELSVFKAAASEQNSADLQVDRGKVQRLFQGVKERKSPSPDGIGGRVLRNWAEQMADILSFIFSWSLQLHRVPCHWKDSVIAPVPKNKSPMSLNNFRPVALTSLACERRSHENSPS